ncbi:MAG: response regulator [Alcanivoracaceae bacterium]|nr:response regulator [Alcanivoracaceae bacterium]
MNKHRILPYYYPTTTVLVDDSQRFLQSFTLYLPDDAAFRCFTSASEALAHINQQASKPHLEQRCFSWFRNSEASHGDTFSLDLSLIEQEINDPMRFSTVSVLVVDYDMPEMNGLELCRQLADPHIRKILLTGVADERIAVQAFNDGLIDRFLMKNDPDIATRINRAIEDSQRQYFQRVSAMLQNTLALKSPEFLYNPTFADYFFALQAQRRFVEYYYVESPSGFVLLDEHGTLARLLVFSEADLQRSLFALRRHQPPASVIQALSAGQAVPWLWATPEEHSEDEPFDWQDHLFPASRVSDGRNTWLCALVEDPPADIEFDAANASYGAYLDLIDSQSPCRQRS